jgi:hypothetical protein
MHEIDIPELRLTVDLPEGPDDRLAGLAEQALGRLAELLAGFRAPATAGWKTLGPLDVPAVRFDQGRPSDDQAAELLAVAASDAIAARLYP